MTETSRHVAFDACFNFRDLGGYPTASGRTLRWARLYRADALHRLTQGDLQAFAGLGIHTVIDLRSMTEVADYGRVSEASGVAWRHLPMLDDVRLAPPDPDAGPVIEEPDGPGPAYLLLAEQYRQSIVQVFGVLGEASAYPAVFHCTAGKDRTGILAALILDILGVPDEVIAQDYALTERAQERSMAWIEEHEPGYSAFLATVPLDLRQARPEKILGFLSCLRHRYGSTRDFLLRSGVPAEALESLARQLLGTDTEPGTRAQNISQWDPRTFRCRGVAPMGWAGSGSRACAQAD